MMPRLTASETAAVVAWSEADSGGFALVVAQLHEMMSGRSSMAALSAPAGFAKFILTIVNSTSGATAKRFADSPAPCASSAPRPLATSPGTPRWWYPGEGGEAEAWG